MSKNNKIKSSRNFSVLRLWQLIGRAGESLRKRVLRNAWADTPIRASNSIWSMRWGKRSLRRSMEFVPPRSASYKPIAKVNDKLASVALFNPVCWIKWSASFALNWLLSRPYAKALSTIPAITLGMGLVTLLLFSTSDQSKIRAPRYRAVFEAAVKDRDYAVATVVLKSLIDSSPQNLEFQYQQALIEALRGNTDLAAKQMDVLATSQNHGLAAMWMISKESNLQELKKWTEPKHARFRQLIEIGLKNLDGENLLSAKVLMFSYLAEIGAYSDAGRYLSEVVPARPELALAAATLCRSQHDATGVAKYATIAERHFESELSRNPTNINARINLARALMIRTKFEDAAKLLNDGYRLTKDSRLAGVTGEALLVWSNHLGAVDVNSRNLVKRLQILRAAIAVAPSDRL